MVHAISNYNREKFDAASELFPFLNAFDELVLSGDVGLVKPDAEIFELLIGRLNLDVKRSVFIDDSANNIATARELGFAASISEKPAQIYAQSFTREVWKRVFERLDAGMYCLCRFGARA